MNLSTKAIAWHAGSMAAGAWGMIIFAQSSGTDLYALIEQLKRTWGELVTLSGMLAPFLAAGAAAYRTYAMKQVPKDVHVLPDNAVAVVPKDSAQPFGTGALTDGVKGTVVAVGKTAIALLLGFLILAAPNDASAQSLNPRALIVADLTAARDEAKADNDPSEQCWQILLDAANNAPPKIMGVAHAVQRARHFRRNLPKVIEACAVVRDGARQAVIGIFGAAAGGASALAALGL